MTVLERALRERVDAGGKVLLPYVTGGLPGVDVELLRDVERAGADAVEVGIPFSDPVMDGPVIQEASRRALEAGTRPAAVLDLVAEAHLGVPVVVMTYLNPVLALGVEAFLRRARDAGVNGVIVPDLPVDEAVEWRRACGDAEIAPVFLAAPGTGRDRLAEVATASAGFVYCVSTYGVTGERGALAATSRELVEALRAVTDLPLVVGVGVSTPEQAAQGCAFADGVVVGSALVKLLLEGDREFALARLKEFREALRAAG